MSPDEKLKLYAALVCVFWCMGMLMYRNVIVSFALCFLALPSKGVYIEFRKSRRKEKLLEGFRDALYLISGSVAAGRQMPQAIKNAAFQLSASYGEDSDIAKEFFDITQGYESAHEDIGRLLSDFARRSTLPEIKQFADSYRVCKKCGGDLEAVCLKSASLLLDRIDFQNEVKTLISQKKLDIVLLTAMPVGVLIFLNLVSFSYIEILYTSLIGRIIMTLCFALIAAALFWGMRIVNLKV